MSDLITSVENETHKIEIFADYDAGSPRDWSNVGTFVMWSSDVVSPDEDDFGGWRVFVAHVFGRYNVIDSDGEPWECDYLTRAEAEEERDKWGSYATNEIVFTPPNDNYIVRGVRYGSQATECFNAEVQVYEEWANGGAFGFVLSERMGVTHAIAFADGTVKRRDYPAWEEIDSCWGFLGYDSYASALGDHLAADLSDLLARLG